MKKPRQIKIWPEIVSYIPILIPIPSDIKQDNVLIDFKNCSQVDAVGLNILLMRLLKMKLDEASQEGQWSLLEPEDNSIKNNLVSLGFLSQLQETLKKQNMQNLFNIDYPTYQKDNALMQEDRAAYIMHSYPIYIFDLDKYIIRRTAFDDFKKWIFRIFSKFHKYDIPQNEILTILKEMFKNSADHTNQNASFAIDIREKKNSLKNCDGIEICFSFTDLGKGIYKNIWDSVSVKEKAKRKTHAGISEAYHKAMQMGFSTKGNTTENMGVGMSIIVDGARSIGMELSVFDAKSRGILTSINKPNTHEEIRKNFYDTGSTVNFCYYGTIFCKELT